MWVNVTFLTYSTCIVRSESGMMERSGCMLLCCEETGVEQGMFWAILQKWAELKTTKDILLKTKDGLLQTEDVLLKTKDSLLKIKDNRK